MTGKELNRKWKVNAKHALYREDGGWYHQLTDFPGALFDKSGYIIFETEEEFRNCPYLRIGQDVNVPDGIAHIPGYVLFTSDQNRQAKESKIKESGTLYEGRATQVKLTRYERDPKARQECLNFHGTSCSICSLNFGKTYGKVAEGLIHVHHLIPLSKIGERHKVDPREDLRPVCPNCHAVIHRRSPPFSIDEVQNMLNSTE